MGTLSTLRPPALPSHPPQTATRFNQDTLQQRLQALLEGTKKSGPTLFSGNLLMTIQAPPYSVGVTVTIKAKRTKQKPYQKSLHLLNKNTDGLVRYEGEWFRNDPEGHGVIEVEVPVIEPVPGSKLEEAMRAEGKIIKRDFMSPEEREWLDKDIEDSYLLANGNFEVPYYERDEWVKEFGEKPEKGRYRYAGQMKHGRMHGCGVYEINDRIIYGRFYFGEILDDDEGCDDQTSALHAGIGEVAAAKARMFVNKPDGSMMFSLDET